MSRSPRLAAFAAATLVAGTLVGVALTSGSAALAADCGVLFDDFNYTSSADSSLTAHGWVPRSYQGGPGVPGATWSASNITFPSAGIMQLNSQTDGTAGGTQHAEIYTSQKRYFEGTYASRVRFTDGPASGTDGDHINQTFFTISPLNGDLDPTYSELDISEYLPNGGWGETGPINYETTWYTYRNDPWYADNTHSEQRQSFDGWHTLVAQVAGGHVKYYIDGTLVGDHSGHFYPRQTMTINYNLWFIDTAAHTSGVSKYVEQVDWLYFAKNQVVAPADAVSKAAAYRSGGNGFVDTVDANGVCTNPSPSFPPSASPSSSARPSSSASPTRSPSSPPSSPLPGGCAGVPAWSFSSVYTTGAKVTHTRSANGDPNGPPSSDGPHLWRAKWWTQGSEPGWTANWEDLGHC